LKYWLREVKNQCGKDIPKIILGNKIDLKESINYNEESLKELCKLHKI